MSAQRGVSCFQEKRVRYTTKFIAAENYLLYLYFNAISLLKFRINCGYIP